MIQRIQTLWLALAAICGFAMSKVPLFTGTLQDASVQTVIATGSLLLFALAIGAACIGIVCIFLFKNRNLQFKLAVTGCILSVVIIALEVLYVEKFKTSTPLLQKGTYQAGGLLPVAMFIFFLMAARGIYKDERLVKSLDRLR